MKMMVIMIEKRVTKQLYSSVRHHQIFPDRLLRKVRVLSAAAGKNEMKMVLAVILYMKPLGTLRVRTDFDGFFYFLQYRCYNIAMADDRLEKPLYRVETPVTPEVLPLPEASERQPVVASVRSEESGRRASRMAPPPGVGVGNTTLAAPRDERFEQIEQILASNLREHYNRLEPGKKRIFKAEGERTARAIKDLVDKGKATMNKIHALITKWLTLLSSSGLGQWWITQEAYIKAKHIMQIFS